MDFDFTIFGLPFVEIIGYIASIIFAVSMLMTSLLRLRWLILLGNIFFIFYGFMLNAYPIIALNIFQLVVNAFFIIQSYLLKGSYTLLTPVIDDVMLDRFLVFYADDIRKFFPNFHTFNPEDNIFMIVKGTAVIGVSAFRKNENNSYDVVIDYAAESHRNMKPAKLLFQQENIFSILNTDKIFAKSYHRKHTKYLKKIKFQPTLLENVFVLSKDKQEEGMSL